MTVLGMVTKIVEIELMDESTIENDGSQGFTIDHLQVSRNVDSQWTALQDETDLEFVLFECETGAQMIEFILKVVKF